MVLKIGICGKEEIGTWKYFENISNLMITSFISNKHYFEKATGMLWYEGGTGTAINMTEHFDRMFDKSWCVEDRLYFSLVEFTNNKGDQFRLACAAGSVYLMNDNGKTIDKY